LRDKVVYGVGEYDETKNIKLGPVTDSEIELGDITLFMGPPNTGKSYILKAIYTKLLPLDYYALKFMEEKLRERLTSYLVSAFTDQALNTFRDLIKTLVKTVLAVAFLPDGDQERDRFEKMLSVLIERAGFKGIIEWREDFLLANIGTSIINVYLDISLLKKAILDSFYDCITELIPIEDMDSLIFEPVELSKIDISFIEEIIERSIHMSPRHLAILFEELLYFVRRYISNDLYGREHYEGITSLLKAEYTKYMALNVKISVKTSIDSLELLFSITFNLRLPTRSPVLRVGYSANIGLNYIERTLDRVFEKARTDPRLGDIIARIVDYMRSVIAKTFADALSKTILYDNLRETFKSWLGVNDLRFIPFGRSMFVLGLEVASREPLWRPGCLRVFIRDFYPNAFASYVYWASEGRSRLLESKLNERHKKLLKAVTPLLEGVLSAGIAGRLMYKDWRGSLVDFQMTSALVEEVSGLVFALLSVEDNAIVLIEEPEAQLHPGAQIIMALFLASLPSLCGCKVVASTHSDLLAITLGQLAVQKPNKQWVKELLERLLEKLLENPSEEMMLHLKEGIDVLAEAVAKSAENLDLKVYEFTREGRVKSVMPEDLLGKEVPGISKVIDELIDWVFRLASYRASKESE